MAGHLAALRLTLDILYPLLFFDSALDFLAVKIQDMVILNVYLPMDYRDDQSDKLFAISIARLSKCIDKIKKCIDKIKKYVK